MGVLSTFSEICSPFGCLELFLKITGIKSASLHFISFAELELLFFTSLSCGRDDDYWDWENNMESISYRWNHEVEYVMTEKGLERVSKQNEESDNNENDNDDNKEDENKAIEDFRKS